MASSGTPREGDVALVLEVVHVVQGRIVVRHPVAGGTDVSSARQQDAVEADQA